MKKTLKARVNEQSMQAAARRAVRVYLPAEVHAMVRQAAAKSGKPMSAYAVAAITEAASKTMKGE